MIWLSRWEVLEKILNLIQLREKEYKRFLIERVNIMHTRTYHIRKIPLMNLIY